MKSKEKEKLLKDADDMLQNSNNYNDSYQYYRILGEEGVTESLFEYGRFLYFGWAGRKNLKKAFQIFLKGAVRGEVMCQWFLANCYEAGEGVEKNDKEAFFWMKEAADGNNPFAINALSAYYHDGIGTAKDLVKSVELTKKMADSDSCSSAQAKNNLAFAYLNGEGVEQDLEKAKHYFKLAIESGCQGEYYRNSTIEGAKNGNPDDKKMLDLCGIEY